MDLREAEDIKKRWQEYTDHNPDNHNGVPLGAASGRDHMAPAPTLLLLEAGTPHSSA